jgi:hypothetical protein
MKMLRVVHVLPDPVHMDLLLLLVGCVPEELSVCSRCLGGLRSCKLDSGSSGYANGHAAPSDCSSLLTVYKYI